jgi:tetratricopeptide (TPR) repeat protein
VIHRDLKPSNIMVGSFGEVQVMDWGLAKVMPRGGTADDASAGKVETNDTVIATNRGVSDSDHSRAGRVLGTPSYMAPEQARGEIDQLDERCVVFALGSILCELLTAQPAFTGRSSGEIQRKAARGDLHDAFARVNGAQADPDLIALTRSCLAPEHDDRPANAGEVAALLVAYQKQVRERLKAAEFGRVEAAARAEEEQKRRVIADQLAVQERAKRRVTVGLAASLILLGSLVGFSWNYWSQQRATRAAAVARVLGEATTLCNLAVATPDEPARWQNALVAIKQAEGVGGDDSNAVSQLSALRRQVEAGADSAARDRVLLERLVDNRSSRADDSDDSDPDLAYEDAFRQAGFDVKIQSAEAVGLAMRARPATVALTMATAVDDWAADRRDLKGDAPGARRLLDVALTADPDPWRNDLRAALEKHDKAQLLALAKSARPDELGPVSLHSLGRAFVRADYPGEAEAVLRSAQRRYPGDLWVTYALARLLNEAGRREEAIRYFHAARAIQPATAHELAHALEKRGEPKESIAIFRELIRMRPKYSNHLACLAVLLRVQGRTEEASHVADQGIAALPEKIRLKPHHAGAHNNLGALLSDDKHEYAAAEAEIRTAIRLSPGFANAYRNLGITLKRQGKLEEAVAAFREAIRVEPENASAYDDLGDFLKEQGKLDEAAAAYRNAIRLAPGDSSCHLRLGVLLCDGKHDYRGAQAEFREAIRLKSLDATAHHNLGVALKNQDNFDEAIVEFREAIRLEPGDATSHDFLGDVLKAVGKLDPAAAEYREAIRLEPDNGGFHNGSAFCSATAKTTSRPRRLSSGPWSGSSPTMPAPTTISATH